MNELAWYLYPLVIFAGLLAGFINTLAGNGSAVTLALLVFLGLSPNEANGTNRVGVAVQCWIGYRAFRKKKMIPTEGLSWLLIPPILGAILGAAIAVELNEQWMNWAMGILMIFLLFLVLLNPKKWLVEQQIDLANVKSWKSAGLLFLAGLHGGFIQAGVGVLLLTILVLNIGYSLQKANGLKLLIVLLFTFPALALFIWNGQVNWFFAILLTVGQSLGAWLAATFATQYKDANLWVRRLLIVVILLGMVKFLILPNIGGD